MESFVKRMIEEHSQLVIRINALEQFLYSKDSDDIIKPQFGNMCIQLKAMRVYAEALEARLVNQNIVYEDGQYFERVADIKKHIDALAENSEGNKNTQRKDE